MTNIFPFVFQIIENIGSLFTSLYDFLFTTIRVPLVGDFSVWSLFGGVGLILIMIWGFIRS